MMSDEPELTEAEVQDAVERAARRLAEDRETIERSLQGIAEAIEEDAGPDDMVELSLWLVTEIPPRADADFKMGVAVRVLGTPPDDSDDPVLHDWISTLPVDSWARAHEEDEEMLVRFVWGEHVEPWLLRHGIGTNREQEVMGECFVEFARKDWR